MYMIEDKEGRGIRYLAPRQFTGEPFQITVRDWAVYEKRLPTFWFLNAAAMSLASLAYWLEPSALTVAMSVLLLAAQLLRFAWNACERSGSRVITINESTKVCPAPMVVTGEHCVRIASISFLVMAIDKQLGFADWEMLVIAISELILLVGVIPLLRSLGLSWRKPS